MGSPHTSLPMVFFRKNAGSSSKSRPGESSLVHINPNQEPACYINSCSLPYSLTMGNKPGGDEQLSGNPPAEFSRPAARSSSMPSMPQASELDRIFEEFLEDKSFRAQQRTALRALDNQQKWTLLCQHKIKQESDKGTVDNPADWIKLLTSPKGVQAAQLRRLRVVISGQGKSWLQEFVEVEGLQSLLGAFTSANNHPERAKRDAIQISVLECLKAFMNNEFGLNVVLSSPQAIHYIALCLDTSNDKLQMQVLQLLTVICWVSGEATLILDALDNFREHTQHRPEFIGSRMKIIMKMLDALNNVDFILGVMTFVNCVINTCDLLEQRVSVREELLALEVMSVIKNIRKWTEQHDGEQYRQLENQCDVFECEMYTDMKSTVLHNLDLSDIDAVYHWLKDVCRENGFMNELLTIMQLLVSVPSEKNVGLIVWSTVAFIVKEATVGRDEMDAEEPCFPYITYSKLRELLTLKEKTERNAQKSQLTKLQDLMEEERKNQHEHKMKAEYANNQCQKLKKHIEFLAKSLDQQGVTVKLGNDMPKLKAKKGFTLGKPVSGKGSKEAPKKPEVKSKDSKPVVCSICGGKPDAKAPSIAAQKTIPGAVKTPTPPSTVQPATDGPTGGPPPPPDLGMGGPPPPPDLGMGGPPPPPDLGMGGPPPPPDLGMGGPPPPPDLGMGGPPPPPNLGMGGPPPPPNLGLGGPPPPPMLGGGGLLAAPVVGPPPKKKPVPTTGVDMRPFHWVVVAPRIVDSTIWKEITDDKVKLDTKELEALFAKASRAPIADKPAEKKTPKKVVINLIEPKKSQNINIALSRFKMSNEAIRDALFAMDEKVFNEETLSLMAKVCPDPDEVDMVLSFEGDLTQLGAAEQFVRGLGEVPQVQKRIQLFHFKIRFPQLVMEIERDLSAVESALKALEGSVNLKKVLSYVLAIGNYLNCQSPKGGAYGFKLSALSKLKDTKTTDNSMTLVHYLVNFLKKQPEKLKVCADLEPVKQAARVESGFFIGEINKMVGQFNIVEGAMRTAADTPKDLYKSVLSDFHAKCAPQAKDMQARVKAAEDLASKIAEQYNEKNMKWEELFNIFGNFVTNLENCQADLLKIAENEEKEKKKQQQRKMMSEMKNQKKQANITAVLGSGKANSKALVDDVFGALKGGDTNSLMDKIRQRRAQKAGGARASRGENVPPTRR